MGWLFFKQRPREYRSLRGPVGCCFPKSPSAGALIGHLRDESRQWTCSFCPRRATTHPPTHTRTIRNTSTSAWISLVAQMIKNPPAMQETRVQSLGWEDPLEKGMATHCSILAWRSQGQRSLAGYGPRGRKELDTTERLTLTF